MNTRGLKRMQRIACKPVSVTAAGTTHEDAFDLDDENLVFAVTNAANAGVCLPKAVPGKIIMIKVVSNAILAVYNYHDDGAYINLVAAETAYSMAAYTTAIFFCTSATQWYTLPLVAS